MAAINWEQLVFRLRKLPNHISNIDEASQLLSDALSIKKDQIIIYSLARSCYIWTPPSKEATLQFRCVPQCLQGQDDKHSWAIPVPGSASDKLLLDVDFEGFTVLNDVTHGDHGVDCIAVSGLASHAFGSWQPHGQDKSFMWLRDALPQSLPYMRVIIYGYDSKLIESTSFQTISDIATTFVNHLKAGGWNSNSSKPFIFLAHSLGGIIVKDALVKAANGTTTDGILKALIGGIMFGVPNSGMEQSHLMTMTKGRANEMLVQDLSRGNGSNYLRQLNKSFEGVSFTEQIRIAWAFETKESRTVVQRSDGTWDKNGPLTVLVNSHSATGQEVKSKSKIPPIPINRDHTNMVKFSRGDPNLDVIISSLSEHITSNVSKPKFGTDSQNKSNSPTFSTNHQARTEIDNPTSKLLQIMSWLKDLDTQLYTPELDFRHDGIDDPFEKTFTWIFELGKFRTWLRNGTGLFWIRGKPASGKSTLMKFILNHPQTLQLLHKFRGNGKELKASFFFHYRGTALQKSFEGVLRSLIIQLLDTHSSRFKAKHISIWESLEPLVDRRRRLSKQSKAIRNDLHRIMTDISFAENKNIQQNRELLEKNKSELETRLGKLMAELQDIERLSTRYLIAFLPYENADDTEFLHQVLSHYFQSPNGIISKLEDLLHQLLEQKIERMNIILFFDALDEFDGSVEVISEFLKALATPPTGLSKVKVCFSSRPLPPLLAEFDQYPAIDLQDYTRADMKTYVSSCLSESLARNPFMHQIVPQLIARANGVFLWVKLAARELSNTESNNFQNASRQLLEEKLQGLPEDLHKFYELMIERISESTRWQTFALLEILVRQSHRLASATEVHQAVSISDCATAFEADETLKIRSFDENTENTLQVDRRLSQEREDIILWGGGLVEIRQGYPELMHQTVLELAMNMQFKSMILGSQSVINNENGHSFIFKILVWRLIYGPTIYTETELSYHGTHFERTTGHSLFGFIDSTPDRILKHYFSREVWPPCYFRDQIQLSPLQSTGLKVLFMVRHDLHLSIRDYFAAYPSQLNSTPPIWYPLSLFTILAYSSLSWIHRNVSLIRLLLEIGYDLSLDENELFGRLVLFESPRLRGRDAVLLWHIAKYNNIILAEGFGDISFGLPDKPPFDGSAIELLDLLLTHGLDVDATLSLYFFDSYWVKPIHCASLPALLWLIQNNAQVNAKDARGLTPLDWRFKAVKRNEAHTGNWGELIKMCVALADAGGTLSNNVSKKQWEKFMKEVEREGLDTSILRQKVPCPKASRSKVDKALSRWQNWAASLFQ